VPWGSRRRPHSAGELIQRLHREHVEPVGAQRRSLGDEHTGMVSQLHRLLLELIPGGAKKDLSAAQAKALLATVRPRDIAGKPRRQLSIA